MKFTKFYFWVYNLLKPAWVRLETKVSSHIVAELKAKNLKEGLRLQNLFRKRRNKQPVSVPPVRLLGVSFWEEELKARQERCKHLKGGRHVKSACLDYNLMHHVFIDGSEVIKCLTCRKEWWNKKDFIDSDWDKAIKMMGCSTNLMSSSEIPSPGKLSTKIIKRLKELGLT
jgi:hypothetical protein